MPPHSDLDPKLIAELVDRFDSAAAEAEDSLDLPEHLGLSEEEKGGPLGRVAVAFHYTTSENRKGGGDNYFRPVMTWSDHQFPPPLEEIPEETVALWEAVGAQTSAFMVGARLNDLLFEGSWSNRGDAGRRAATAYIMIGDEEFSSSNVIADGRKTLAGATALIRALTLARKLGDDALAQRSITSLTNAAAKAVERDQPAPGAAYRLLHALSRDRTDIPEMDSLLSQARLIFEDDVWQTEHIIALQLRQAKGDAEATRSLQREDVEGWLAEADRSDGIRRMKHLESAVKKARDYGLTDLVEEATGKLQEVDPDNLGLVRREFAVEIPTAALELYMAYFTEAPTWQGALERLISLDPPSGNLESNRDQIDQMSGEALIFHLVTKVRIGGDGLPRFTATNEEQRAEWLLAEQERLSIDLKAPLITEILRRIWSKWGPITEDEFAEFLGQRGHVPFGMAPSLARAFIRHFTGDAEGSAYTLMPKVEALVRSIVVQCRRPVYNIQRQRRPGQYPGLGALLPILADLGIDESWSRFLHTFLASVAGYNERNELLHGFVNDISETTSSLIVLVVVYLAVGLRLVDPVGE